MQLHIIQDSPVYGSTELIQKNISLADKNWFKTGGLARFYAEPRWPQEFQAAVKFAQENNLEIFLLGEGANILISDDGFDGLVIRPKLQEIEIIQESPTHAFVRAGAGRNFQSLIDWCLEHQLTDLEEFSGIPGTVGGSVFINIHYFEFLLSRFLVSATVIEKSSGKLLAVDQEWFAFGYDYSTLHKQEHYLIDATFRLTKADAIQAAYARGRATEIRRHREKRYPTKYTCGSFFRNFHDHEVTLYSAGRKLIFVAYYLDKIGVKGELSHGNAIVSYQHANMIVHQGNATSSDIINLAKKMQELVYERFSLTPQPECQLIGFKNYPLHFANDTRLL